MPSERTVLTPAEEALFQQWVRAKGITDLDHPDSRYDYRGYWKDIASQGKDASAINSTDGLLHYTDTYKQHGHPTFSVESQYSRGLQDGGRWIGETLVAPPMPSHGAVSSIDELFRVLAQSLPRRRSR